MQTPDISYDWAKSILTLYEADSDQIGELVRAADLDPYGADLANVDLSGLDLSSQDFSGWNLEFADFSRSNISKANFLGAKLSVSSLLHAINWQSAVFDENFAEELAKAATGEFSDCKVVTVFLPKSLVAKLFRDLEGVLDGRTPKLTRTAVNFIRNHIMAALNTLAENGKPVIIDAINRALTSNLTKNPESKLEELKQYTYIPQVMTANRESKLLSLLRRLKINNDAKFEIGITIGGSDVEIKIVSYRESSIADIIDIVVRNTETAVYENRESWARRNIRPHRLVELQVPIDSLTLARLEAFTIGSFPRLIGARNALFLVGCIMGTKWLPTPKRIPSGRRSGR